MHIPFVYCLKNMFASLKHQFSFFCLASSHFNGSSPTTDNNLKWRDGMNRCKSSGVYLIGKINLTNIVSACQTFTHNQRWIGVVKESYTSYDQGKGKSKARKAT